MFVCLIHIVYIVYSCIYPNAHRTDVYVTIYEEIPEVNVDSTESMMYNATHGVPPN